MAAYLSCPGLDIEWDSIKREKKFRVYMVLAPLNLGLFQECFSLNQQAITIISHRVDEFVWILYMKQTRVKNGDDFIRLGRIALEERFLKWILFSPAWPYRPISTRVDLKSLVHSTIAHWCVSWVPGIISTRAKRHV